MITLIELIDITRLPMKDAETGKRIDSKVVLKHPDAIVKSISFDTNTIDFVVEYVKEPEDEND